MRTYNTSGGNADSNQQARIAASSLRLVDIPIELIKKLYNSHITKLHGKLMKILIRNLARTTTETELLTLFQAHGAVQSCNLVLDKDTGLSKGFGFVEMPKPGEAKAAITSLNGLAIAGFKIRVKKSE